MDSYETFINLLRKEEGQILRDKLTAFLVGFRQQVKMLSLAQQRRQVAAFMASIGTDSYNHLCFMQDGNFDKEMVREGWEKLVMAKIFDQVFAPAGTDETASNFVLVKKIETYSWIEERHLDLAINFSLSLEPAQAELLRINGFRSPRDKLSVLQNVLQLLVDLIKKKTDGSASATDSLLPTLILVIIRANPNKLISNLKYVMRYRSSHEIEKGENQFCMTNFMSAVSFIYNMEAKSLTLNEEEKAKWPGWSNNPGERFADRIQKSAEPGGDLHRVANQVTGFFGNFFKDVKETTNEIIKDIKGSPTGSPGNRSATSSPVFKQDAERQRLEREEREKYELELAIAMSLSETTQDNQVKDIDSFAPSPSKPMAEMKLNEDDEEEEKLVRSSKKTESDGPNASASGTNQDSLKK